MAITSISTNWSALFRFSNHSKHSLYLPQSTISLRFSRSSLSCGKPLSIRATAVPAAPTAEGLAPAITLTDNALRHLNKMRAERDEDLCLRIGVKQGGCSGMSYTMDFEKRSNARADDSIIEYNGFTIGSCKQYCL
ncbi:hypothetical protein ES319_A10G090000v1 [Gossypium barbadense]|uniref:Iron-sulfur assembly protein IscA, chloroplastic isoform X2 n=2 Tax=Gossypium TaxID=3633 RepID=A0ABM2YW31_GOSHI|nr:iron-sulfur assembly protein IscA, chloroplastic isoform X2 [Gossypium arboreum]XP_040934713.1 iron-sulfur assembly protein IscA, chloroplastic isoform X2 [Gossypium hirsutum]KAB2061509.1 hypothetical protein ES319_A10G090000v1 [Gossypium barbadense]